MKSETLQEFMSKVEIMNKDIAIYTNEEKGVKYPLSLASLLTRIDYLELTKEEVEKAKFEQQIEKKDYKMYDCTKIVSKYELTKIDADRFVLTDKKVKATHIWNVTNQIGIHATFEDKKEAFRLCTEINDKVLNALK